MIPRHSAFYYIFIFKKLINSEQLNDINVTVTINVLSYNDQTDLPDLNDNLKPHLI